MRSASSATTWPWTSACARRNSASSTATRALGIEAKFPELAAQRALVGKFYFRPPGGESWCDVILRLRSVLEMLRRDHVGERVLIVAHQVIVNCFRYLLECLDEARSWRSTARATCPTAASPNTR